MGPRLTPCLLAARGWPTTRPSHRCEWLPSGCRPWRSAGPPATKQPARLGQGQSRRQAGGWYRCRTAPAHIPAQVRLLGLITLNSKKIATESLVFPRQDYYGSKWWFNSLHFQIGCFGAPIFCLKPFILVLNWKQPIAIAFLLLPNTPKIIFF